MIGGIWDFLAGLGMGIIGYTILAEIVKPNCPNPNCGKKLDEESRHVIGATQDWSGNKL